MMFQQAVVLLCLLFVPLAAAALPAHIHEVRQGGPIGDTSSPTTSTSTSSKATTTTTTTTTSRTTSTSTSATSKTSSAMAQPTPTPGGINFIVQNMTTCTSGLISWDYSGQGAQLSLSISNIDQDSTSSTTINSTIQQLVVTNTSAQNWTWSPVNVNQGWYEIQGVVLASPNITNSSSPFYVSDGTNIACLTNTSPQTSSTPSSQSSTNVGSIVGGVVGGVVGILLVIIVGVFMWRRKRRVTRGGESKNGKWGSLKSGHSSVQPAGEGTPPPNNRFHTHSDSTGAILRDVEGGRMSATNTPGDSDEDITATAEKLVSPASSPSMSPVDALNTPVHYDRRASLYNTQTPTSLSREGSWSHSATRRISNQSLEQQAQRIRSSMETSNRRRGERLSMPSMPPPSLTRLPHSPSLAQSREEYPLSRVTPTPVNRSISAGAVSMTARRASRKPVPQYDPSLLLEDASADSVSTFTAGADSSHSHGTGTLTATNGTQPDLVRKASFGDGRPVHYLIPDMPLPQQD